MGPRKCAFVATMPLLFVGFAASGTLATSCSQAETCHDLGDSSRDGHVAASLLQHTQRRSQSQHAMFALPDEDQTTIQQMFPDVVDLSCLPGTSCTTGGIPAARGACIMLARGLAERPNECWDICNEEHLPQDYTTGDRDFEEKLADAVGTVRRGEYAHMRCPSQNTLPEQGRTSEEPITSWGNATALNGTGGCCFSFGYGSEHEPCCLSTQNVSDSRFCPEEAAAQLIGGKVGFSPGACPSTAAEAHATLTAPKECEAICCRGMTSTCLACSACVDEATYCRDHPETFGCSSVAPNFTTDNKAPGIGNGADLEDIRRKLVECETAANQTSDLRKEIENIEAAIKQAKAFGKLANHSLHLLRADVAMKRKFADERDEAFRSCTEALEEQQIRANSAQGRVAEARGEENQENNWEGLNNGGSGIDNWSSNNSAQARVATAGGEANHENNWEGAIDGGSGIDNWSSTNNNLNNYDPYDPYAERPKEIVQVGSEGDLVPWGRGDDILKSDNMENDDFYK